MKCVTLVWWKIRCTVYGSVEVEYRHDDGTDRLRPDLMFEGLNLNLLSDVAVTTPSNASVGSRAAKVPLAAARVIEKFKRNKYRALAERERILFTPFVVETYGAVGPGAMEVLSALADRAEWRSVWMVCGQNVFG